MEPLDPIKSPILQGIPLTEEWFHQQKKLLKEGKMETPATAEEAADVYTPSPQAAELSKTKPQVFMENVKSSLLKMDPASEHYLPEATSFLVNSALRQEFGEEIISNPGYSQMEQVLTRTILNNPKHTEIIQDFLELVNSSEESGQ